MIHLILDFTCRDCPVCKTVEADFENENSLVEHSGAALFLVTWNSKIVIDSDPAGIFPFDHHSDGKMNVLIMETFSVLKIAISMFVKPVMQIIAPKFHSEDKTWTQQFWNTAAHQIPFAKDIEIDVSENATLPDFMLDGEFNADESKIQVPRVRFCICQGLLHVFGAGIDGTIPPWKGDPKSYNLPLALLVFIGLLLLVIFFVYVSMGLLI
jgi:hypothetical protein